MDNPGLYLSDSSVELNGTTWKRKTLYNNGVKVFQTSASKNNFGTYVIDGTMYVDGEPVVSESYSPECNNSLYPTFDGEASKIEYMGTEVYHEQDPDLGVKCINVTLSDYHRLLDGEIPNGYRRFDMNSLYNIVDVVEGSPEVFVKVDAENPRKYTVTEDGVSKDYYDYPKEFGLLNNLQGYHLLEPTSRKSTTFTLLDSPQLSIHDPVFRAAPGDCIDVTYMVDTHDCDFSDSSRIGERFTVTIRDQNDNILYTNTTYAGVFTVRIKPFLIDPTGENVASNYVKGAAWYSVEAIDSRGCGSCMVYADIFFDEFYNVPDSERDFVTLTEQDLLDSGAFISTAGSPIDDTFDEEYCGELGWTGNYVYNGGGCLKIGCADHIGYINSPNLWTSDSTGTVSVSLVISAKYGMYYAPIRVSCGNQYRIVQLTNTFASYRVTFNDVDKEEASTIRISTVYEERRVYIQSVSVLVDEVQHECSFSVVGNSEIPEEEDVDVTYNDAEAGYWNITKINSLLASIADGSYDGSSGHEGVVFPKDCVFYTSYEGNQSNTPESEFELKPITFYVAKVEKSIIVDGETVNYPYGIVTELQEITENGTIHIDGGNYKQEIWRTNAKGERVQEYGYDAGSDVFPCHLDSGNYTVDCDPLHFVIHDGAHILRVKNFNSNASSEYMDKIFVRWEDAGVVVQDNADGGDTEDEELIVDTESPVSQFGTQDGLPGCKIPTQEYYNVVKYASNGIAAHEYPYVRTFDLSYIGDPNGATTAAQTGTHTGKHRIEPGYYYVVSNKRRTGPKLIFPNNFVVDLNGCTFKAAYCTSINTSDVFGPSCRYNLHVKNGKFVGLYDRFRSRTESGARWRGFVEGALCCAITGKFVGEGLNTMTSFGSEFCIYENLDISSSIGYNCRNMATTNSRTTFNLNNGGNNINTLGYVDYSGNFITDESAIVVGELPNNSKEFHYDSTKISSIPSRSYYLRDLAGVSSDAVLKQTLRITLTHTNVCNFTPKRAVGPTDSIRPGRQDFEDDCYICGFYGMPYENGRSNIVFVSWFDGNGNFINTIKTECWNRFKAPVDAAKVVLTGYGLSHIKNGIRVPILYNGINVCFFADNPGCIGVDTQRKVNAAVLYKDCYIHDTRSGAFSVEGIDGVTFDGCIVECAADCPRSDWFTTGLLSAFEDGRYATNMLTLKNLTIKAPTVKYDGSLSCASTQINAAHCRNYTAFNINTDESIPGPKKLYHHEIGLLDDGYIHDCNLSGFNAYRRISIPKPHFIYRHLRVSEFIFYNVREDGFSIYTNRSEEPPSNKATVWDAFIRGIKLHNYVTDMSDTMYFTFRQSKIVNDTYE